MGPTDKCHFVTNERNYEIIADEFTITVMITALLGSVVCLRETKELPKCDVNAQTCNKFEHVTRCVKLGTTCICISKTIVVPISIL